MSGLYCNREDNIFGSELVYITKICLVDNPLCEMMINVLNMNVHWNGSPKDISIVYAPEFL